MNKKFLAQILSFILLFIFILPLISLAADPLVPCGNTIKYVDGKAVTCNFDDFILMINGIIKWIISIAGVIFTLSAIWGGYLYMTSGSNPGNKDKAKSVLWSTLIGFVIILTAWLIVYTILVNLVSDSSSIFRFIKKI
jgi:hypothetical protein